LADLGCDKVTHGDSTNSKAGAPFANVVVFDEGGAFMAALRKAIPKLPEREVGWRLMK